MKKTLIGIVVGGTIVLLVNFAMNWLEDVSLAKRTAALQTAESTDWINILSFRVDGAPPGPVPTAHIRFEVLKPVAVRTEISPRNVKTGASLCSGRLSSVYTEPRAPLTVSIPVAAMAGLESCRFPAGDYSVSVTITPTDLELGVQLKPITFESAFTVAPPF